MVNVRIASLQLSDGQTIEIPAAGVVLLVGPNNAGKSQTLKDMLGISRDRSSYRPKALGNAQFERENVVDPYEWIANSLPHIVRDGIPRVMVAGWGEVSPTDIAGQLGNPDPGVLTSLFMLHADGTTRLVAGDSQGSIDYSTQLPVHPMHRAYIEPGIEDRLREMSRAAFGTSLVVDRYAGAVTTIRIGDAPEFEHENGRPSKSYIESLKLLPRLEDQGDGVRSYIGLLLHMLAGTHDIILVDEPEAFLHPPQARQLGRVLAQRSGSGQSFIATHSSDIVQGSLEDAASTTIIRITRENGVNHAAVLSHNAVQELWSDPLLRYSRVLDGLFHDVVVVCESDSDCLYYSAVYDNLPAKEETANPRRPSVLFTYAGGKARLASVAAALQAVSVPVIVIADFDVLRNSSDVSRILTALGTSYDALQRDAAIVNAALQSDAKPLRKNTLRDDLIGRLDNMSDEISDKDAQDLRSAIRADTGWDKAKRAGKASVPPGDPYRACERLLSGLAQAGLLVVPVGELERFAPTISGHGPNWASNVLAAGLHKTPSAEARSFISTLRDLIEEFSGRVPSGYAIALEGEA